MRTLQVSQFFYCDKMDNPLAFVASGDCGKRLYWSGQSDQNISKLINVLDKDQIKSHHIIVSLIKGTDRIDKSKQYQSTMTFQLTAVKKKVLKVNEPNIRHFGYINPSDESESEGETKMNEDEEY